MTKPISEGDQLLRLQEDAEKRTQAVAHVCHEEIQCREPVKRPIHREVRNSADLQFKAVRGK